jgi:hypothetical protein
MFRQFAWLMFDFTLGIVLTGVLAPLAIGLLPERFRGAAALWVLAVVSVGLVTGCRRVLGIGAVNRPS